MRLIDADKLKQELKANGLGYQYYMLDNAPTVKAIPIEFIKEQIAKTTDINDEDEFDVFYAGHLGYLLNLWEEQNEKDI